MIYYLHLFCLIILFFGKINTLPIHRHRYRRQINLPSGLPIGRVISGSIPGTYYYGVGSDPNYGSFIQRPNRPNGGGIVPISYDPDSSLYQNLIRESHDHPQQQKLPNYLYNNNNNNYAWLPQNVNKNQNPYYNPYAPGSQGWYATNGNYWYNNAKCIIACPYLLLISIALLIFCK